MEMSAMGKEISQVSFPELTKGMVAMLRAVPFDRNLLGGLGDFRVDTQTVVEAIRQLQQAVVLQPRSADVCALCAIAITVLSGGTESEVKKGLVLLDAALEVDPQHYLARLARGVVENQLSDLRQATQHHPTRPEAWLVLGTRYRSDGTKDQQLSEAEATAALRTALQLRPSSRFVVGWVGQRFRLFGHEREAAKIFRRAAADGVWHHELQRPREVFWPNLRTTPLLGKMLEAEWPMIKEVRQMVERSLQQLPIVEEFKFVRARYTPHERPNSWTYWLQKCMPDSSCFSQGVNLLGTQDKAEGKWAEYRIWDPVWFDVHQCAEHFPNTCTMLGALWRRGVPLTRLGISEVYPPKTYIPRHHTVNQGRLRLFCPLVVPTGSRSHLVFPDVGNLSFDQSATGACWWFDESFEHELFYEGTEPRASLVFDIPHPSLLHGSPLLEPDIECPSYPRHWCFLYMPILEFVVSLGLGKYVKAPVMNFTGRAFSKKLPQHRTDESGDSWSSGNVGVINAAQSVTRHTRHIHADHVAHQRATGRYVTQPSFNRRM